MRVIQRFLITASVAAGLFSTPILAREGEMSEKQFYTMAHVMREQPKAREQVRDACLAAGMTELDSIPDPNPEKLIEKVCLSLINGIVSGAINYEDYTRWMTTTEEWVNLPLYE